MVEAGRPSAADNDRGPHPVRRRSSRICWSTSGARYGGRRWPRLASSTGRPTTSATPTPGTRSPPESRSLPSPTRWATPTSRAPSRCTADGPLNAAKLQRRFAKRGRQAPNLHPNGVQTRYHSQSRTPTFDTSIAMKTTMNRSVLGKNARNLTIRQMAPTCGFTRLTPWQGGQVRRTVAACAKMHIPTRVASSLGRRSTSAMW